MKLNYYLFSTMLFMGLTAQAQVDWLYDLNLAKAIATDQGKLLVVDFWATWCGPCKTMDKDLWNTEAANAFKDKAIFVKVDVDLNQDIANRFNVGGIPDVRIIDVAENIYWSEIGFRNETPFLREFEELPSNLLNINEYLLKSSLKEATASDHLNTGKALIFLTKKIQSEKWKKEMYELSKSYLKKSWKEDKELKTQTELIEYTGLCVLGQCKKAYDKIAKMDVDGLEGEEKQLYELIHAFYSLENKNSEEFVAHFSQVKDPFFQSLLR